MDNDVGAFISAAKIMVEEALNNIIRSLEGLDATPSVIVKKSELWELVCLETHTRYIDAGIGGVSVQVVEGEIVHTSDLSIHSVDLSKYDIISLSED